MGWFQVGQVETGCAGQEEGDGLSTPVGRACCAPFLFAVKGVSGLHPYLQISLSKEKRNKKKIISMSHAKLFSNTDQFV